MSGLWRLLAWTLACCLAASAGRAESSGTGGNETFRISGFGTLGAVRTTSDDVEFVRDLSQARGASTEWSAKTESLLGLQVDWQPSPKWRSHPRH